MSTAIREPEVVLPRLERTSYISARDRAHRSACYAISTLLGDILCICAGILCGFWIRFFSGLPNEMNYESFTRGFEDYSQLMFLGAGIYTFLLLSRGSYELNKIVRFREASREVVSCGLIWLGAFLSLALILKLNPSISRLFVLFSATASTSLLLAWRYGFTRYIRTESVASVLSQRVLIVGWNEQAAQLVEAIKADPSPQYSVAGCMASQKGTFDIAPPLNVRRLGSIHDFEHIIQSQEIDVVIAVDLDPNTQELLQLSSLCERNMIQFKIVPTFFRVMLSGLQLENVDGIPMLGMGRLPLQQPLNRVIKRGVDIAGGIVGLCMTMPIILLFGLLVYMESKGPIFYKQVRTGRDGRLFKIVKIRSMRLDAEAPGVAGWTTENDPRRLRVGALMRRLNIDELPQFWNVVKGEMSLVGPRPERPELIRQFRKCIPHYNARHFVKPGITGWAQVNGLRGNTDLTQRILHDLFYMERWSLWFDLLILFRTLRSSKNAY